MNNNPLVSVIVPTLNSGKNLETCLKSSKMQSYQKIEVIVVDNNSTDNTKKIARKYTKKVYNYGPERSAQRNFGAKKSRGQYLLFIDSDMELSREVVRDCVDKIKSSTKKISGIFIPEESIASNFWETVKGFERSFYNLRGDKGTDAARFFPKKLFLKLGGYDENITGPEDWDLSERISSNNHNILRITSKIYHHENIRSLKKLMEKKYYHGRKMYEYLEKNNLSILTPKTIYFIRPIFYKQWKRLIRHPIKGFSMLFMLFCEQIAGGLGYLSGKYNKKKLLIKNKTKNYIYPKVSFVIPTYNAQKYLRLCLNSIKIQNYPKNKMEIIIVDGGSTDKTLEIVKKYTKKIYFNKKRIAEYGKAIGIKQSLGKYFVLIDADNEIVQKNWLQNMVNPVLENKWILGVESPLSHDNKLSSLNRYFARIRIADPLAKYLVSKPAEIIYSKNYRILKFRENSVILTGANGFLWNKPLLKELGGWGNKFEESYYPNRLELTKELAYAIPNNISVRHFYSSNIVDFLRKRSKIAIKTIGKIKNNEFLWINMVSKIKVIVTIIYLGTFIGPSIEALYRGIKEKSIDYVWHPIVCFLTVIIYCYNFIDKD